MDNFSSDPSQDRPYSPYAQAYTEPPQSHSPPEQPISYTNIPPQSPPERGSIITANIMKLVLKVLGGLALLLVIILVVTKVILPLLAGNKEKDVTLTYWGVVEDPAVMKPLLDEFHKEHPHITVEYSQQDPAHYAKRVTERIKNGTGPDLYSFHNTWLPMLGNYLLPLPTDVITPAEFNSAYYPFVRRDLVRSGAIYGIPLGIDTLSLFINPDIFAAAGQQPPRTWEDFIKVAKALTVKDQDGKIKTAGAAMGTVDNITHAPDILAMLFMQNGTDLYSIDSTPQNAADALTFYTAFAKDAGNVWDGTLDPSLLAFAKGNLGMYFGYSRDLFQMKSTNPNLNVSLVPVPALPQRTMTVTSYWAEGVSIKSQHQKEALLFMQFLAQKKTAQLFYQVTSQERLFGEPPARMDLADMAKDNQYASPILQQASSAVSTYFVGGLQDDGINSQMDGYIENAVRSASGNSSPADAVAPLSAGVKQVLSAYGF